MNLFDFKSLSRFVSAFAGQYNKIHCMSYPYRILGVEKDRGLNHHLILIQIAGKDNVIKQTACDFVNDEYFMNNISPADIQTITYTNCNKFHGILT